jgi:phytoene/squalene synthetase
MTTQQERDTLAAETTRRASKQTYYIFRFFADRERVFDAYRSYAYFRWLDDILDSPNGKNGKNEAKHNYKLLDQSQKIDFVNRQRKLLTRFYLGDFSGDLKPMEMLLKDLVESDPDMGSGLYLYLDNMMKVMEFDAERRDRDITEQELEDYSTTLALAVTELLHYFIGHDSPQPKVEARYHSVKAAHITHMLRDALEDAEDGYINIPQNYLDEHQISPTEVQADAFRNWACDRIQLANDLFQSGQSYISQGKSFKRRLAGLAYTARFMWVMQTIEKENYCLREGYPDRKRLPAFLWMLSFILKSSWRSLFTTQRYISLINYHGREN